MTALDLLSTRLCRRGLLRASALSAAALCVPIRAAAPNVGLAEIIRRNTLARGGAAALDRVRSIAVDVEIVEGGQALNGRYAANDQGLVRIDVYAAGKLVASEGIDSNGVWILGKDGPEPSVAVGAANALLHGAENHLFGWHRFADRGHKLALMPTSTIDGTPYHVVEVRFSTGHVSYFYVDPQSWQAARRRDERAYHPDVDQTKKRVESRSLDFRSVDGVVAPHRNEDYDLATGKLLAENRVLSRRLNPALAADHFDRDRRAPASL
jgi:hypothetical protein